jgi:PAS domain S-box-containing protein
VSGASGVSPIAVAPAGLHEPRGEPAGAVRPISVLVVDDDTDHVELVRRVLRRHNAALEVDHARDGDACLAALGRHAYSLVLLDYRLPRMTGIEVLERIRARGVQVPVMMATGQGDERVAVEAMKAGAVDYVIKTAGYFATLPTAVEKALRQDALARENARLSEEARRQQARLRQIYDSTSDGIVLLETDGRVVVANRQAGALLGLDAAEAAGRSLVELVAARDVDAVARQLAAMLDQPGQPAEGDLAIGPEPRVLHWVAQPTAAAGGEAGVTLTFHDVTQEREISRMKSEFVAFVAHQLRTPLSGIKWMLELGRQEPEIPPAVLSYMDDAALSADRLIEMVNDLLDVARLESGRFTIDAAEARIEDLTRDIVAQMDGQIAAHGHTVTVESAPDLPPVIVDRPLVRQVLTNLVSNAVKYTGTGGAIRIRASAIDEAVRWEIRDTGIGIPRDALARLGEKFFRADNAQMMDADGTGLGLYLVRLITRALGGTISWTSEEGAGTTFVLTLPVKG